MFLSETDTHVLHITWRHPEAVATLTADLRSHSFTVSHGNGTTEEVLMSF